LHSSCSRSGNFRFLAIIIAEEVTGFMAYRDKKASDQDHLRHVDSFYKTKKKTFQGSFSALEYVLSSIYSRLALKEFGLAEMNLLHRILDRGQPVRSCVR